MHGAGRPTEVGGARPAADVWQDAGAPPLLFPLFFLVASEVQGSRRRRDAR